MIDWVVTQQEGEQIAAVNRDELRNIASATTFSPGGSPEFGETDTLRRMKMQKPADGTVHKLPEDFRRAIESNATAKNLWADITPLARNEWICWVTSAKQDATRQRRIVVGIDKMQGGMRRPCCWPGCPHR